MVVIVVANRKGGVGKTTVSANLAYELSKMGFLTVMVDLDGQCDLSKVYSLDSIQSYNILDVLTDQCELDDAVIEIETNLYAVPGSREITHYKGNDAGEKLSQKLSNESLELVEFVIIDTPPNLNEATLEGLIAANEVLIVTDAETFGIDNISNFLDDLQSIKQAMNRKLHVIGVVANRVDFRRNLTKTKIMELRKALGRNMFNTLITNNTAIPTSISRKTPIRGLGRASDSLKQFRELTNEILERLGIQNGNG